MFRLTTLALLLALPGAAGATMAAPAMSEAELAEARGGFALPGGLSIAIGVTTETKVDGATVLRSVYSVDQVASLKLFDAAGNAVSPGAAGAISTRQIANGTMIQYKGAAIDIGHIVGGAYGSVLANRGDNRAIDISTTIDLEIAGATAELIGSAGMRAEALALDATARLAR